MSDLFKKNEAEVLQTGLNAMTNANTALLNQNQLLMQQINDLNAKVQQLQSKALVNMEDKE
jgi:hypothetical protein